MLGDSTAAGVGAGSAEDSYPAVLAQMLGDTGLRVHLTGVGVSGARVADVLAAQVAIAEREKPDLVFVGIGANDTTHVTPLDDVRSDMATILERLSATGARVVVAGAPDMRAAAWPEPLRSLAGLRGRAVTGAIGEAASAARVPIVPLAEETAPYFAADPDRYNSADLFHPGPAGYERWAAAIYPYLERELARIAP